MTDDRAKVSRHICISVPYALERDIFRSTLLELAKLYCTCLKFVRCSVEDV